jgi:hypothetical protein
LDLFEKIFGYRSKSFIAPNYTWSSELESYLKQLGVQTIQGARAQRQPIQDGVHIKKHKMGERNAEGQVFLLRNVAFEPSLIPSNDWFSSVIWEISNAFFWNKPAIISSHRLNFIGCLDKQNRENNLMLFREILESIIKKWPEVEFMTSDQLGQIILESKQ